jgi:rubrerythrin
MRPRKGAATARAPAAPRPPQARTIRELMAHAHALEVEASERYAEFAEAMDAHNNRDVAELFRKLARIEHRHAEQILEEMRWTTPLPPPSDGYRWEGLEAPETADFGALHYLMQPYHALAIALRNERRAEEFFRRLAASAASAKVRRQAAAMAAEEAEHVRLIEEWMQRTPQPEAGWDLDPDPPRHVD